MNEKQMGEGKLNGRLTPGVHADDGVLVEYVAPKEKVRYDVQAQLQRLTDAFFDLATAWKGDDPEFALECLKEARSVVKIAVDAKGAVRGAQGVMTGVKLVKHQQALQARVLERKRLLEHGGPHAVAGVQHTRASYETVDVDGEDETQDDETRDERDSRDDLDVDDALEEAYEANERTNARLDERNEGGQDDERQEGCNGREGRNGREGGSGAAHEHDERNRRNGRNGRNDINDPHAPNTELSHVGKVIARLKRKGNGRGEPEYELDARTRVERRGRPRKGSVPRE